MKDEPPAKRRIRLGKLRWWMVAAFASAIGWQMWKLHLYNAAVREAKEAGFKWRCHDPFSLIRQDWRAALKKETWGVHRRELDLEMGGVPDLGRYRDLLHRLRPTDLTIGGCENVDVLKEITDLKTLALICCRRLQNVDVLKGLTGLKTLSLSGCDALQNVDGLRHSTGLQSLILLACPKLQNVEGLKSLTGLQMLVLSGSDKIPAVALRELRAALPNTDITFPDGSKNPPQ